MVTDVSEEVTPLAFEDLQPKGVQELQHNLAFKLWAPAALQETTTTEVQTAIGTM